MPTKGEFAMNGYLHLLTTSTDTALRDILDLMAKGIFEKKRAEEGVRIMFLSNS